MDGIVNLLKPPGMTSNDCVAVARRALSYKHIGHMGTLDPAAAGVLPLGIGRAARLFDYAIGVPKTYTAEMTLGITTDTQDQQGRVLSARHTDAGRAEIEALLPYFVGDIMQVPPAYSALKVGGVALYTHARRGEAVTVQPRVITIYALDYLYQSGAYSHMLRITCGGGAYVRSLFSDIGERLGCGAHCSFLLRESSCGLSIQDAYGIDALLAGAVPLLSPDAVLGHMKVMDISRAHLAQLGYGRPIPATNPAGHYRAYADGVFIGIMETGPEGTARMRVPFYRLT